MAFDPSWETGGTLPSSHSNSIAYGIYGANNSFENNFAEHYGLDAVYHSTLGVAVNPPRMGNTGLKVTERNIAAIPSDISALPTEHVNEKGPVASSFVAVVSENARGMGIQQTSGLLCALFAAMVREMTRCR
ncbi:hypothetical protein FNV43_RR24653 [Rhamnella rubrinervis]|uniref:Uncharacterized protein n=1 Tax=Rhamnella rubrinervis TaxID=2594499 RepID=A0A8K0DN68_9ROSA|nr:hypothetical protein FNV43_RR24653 [Rhamnella rubrinervis]